MPRRFRLIVPCYLVMTMMIGMMSGCDRAAQSWSAYVRPPCGLEVSNGGSDISRSTEEMAYQLQLIPFHYFVEWSPNGVEIVFSEYRDGSYVAMHVVDNHGASMREVHAAGVSDLYAYGVHADVSHDGSMLAMTVCRYLPAALIRDGSLYGPDERRSDPQADAYEFYEIVTMNMHGAMTERVTENPYNDFFPMWSPRENTVAFLVDRDGYDHHRYQEVHVKRGEWDSFLLIREEDFGQKATRYEPALATYPPMWSPDGKSVAVLARESIDERRRLFAEDLPIYWADVFSNSWGLYIVDAGGAGAVRLTGTVGGVSWAPDGAQLAVMKVVGDGVALVTMDADGTDLRVITRLTKDEVLGALGASRRFEARGLGGPWLRPVSWSPDGSHILFRCGRRLCVVGLDGERVDAWPLEDVNPRTRSQAAWSPDGSRLAVVGEFAAGPATSDPTFRTVLFTVAVDGTDLRFLAGRVGDGKLEVLDAG